ncbi:MAG: phosphoribosyltransferase [Verrucomicrobia bacterium]|nr:MAG: phosphoribosyltransferase [Verrucomicrobiota bacterium]
MERAFPNRTEAGRLLAGRLVKYAGRDDVIVLGLPRGGVPVAFEVAQRLGAPLDVFIVRKLGVPGFEELAAGAIASGGVRVLNEDVVRALPNAEETIESIGPPDTCHELEEQADETICLSMPEFFQAVGQYYEDFSQTSDEDVRELLARGAQQRAVSGEQEQE